MKTYPDRFEDEFTEKRERAQLCYDTLMRQGKVDDLHRQLKTLLRMKGDFFSITFDCSKDGLSVYVRSDLDDLDPTRIVDFSSTGYLPFYELSRHLEDYPIRYTVIHFVDELIKALPTVKAQRLNGKEIDVFTFTVSYDIHSNPAFYSKVFIW